MSTGTKMLFQTGAVQRLRVQSLKGPGVMALSYTLANENAMEFASLN